MFHLLESIHRSRRAITQRTRCSISLRASFKPHRNERPYFLLNIWAAIENSHFLHLELKRQLFRIQHPSLRAQEMLSAIRRIAL